MFFEDCILAMRGYYDCNPRGVLRIGHEESTDKLIKLDCEVRARTLTMPRAITAREHTIGTGVVEYESKYIAVRSRI